MLTFPYPRIHARSHFLPTTHTPQKPSNQLHTPSTPRYTSGICTHLGSTKGHNHPLGNDPAEALANQVAYGHHPERTYNTESDVSIGTLTWPCTLIPHTHGDPTPFRYTTLEANAHYYNNKQTHTPLSRTTKHGALSASAASDGANFSFHKKHTSLANIQCTHKHQLMWGVHNTRLLPHNHTLRYPMCAQFTLTDTWHVTTPKCRASSKTCTIAL
jgi:hypothetical protein